MIRRPPRSTQSRSSAASDVYKRQDRPAAGIPRRRNSDCRPPRAPGQQGPGLFLPSPRHRPGRPRQPALRSRPVRRHRALAGNPQRKVVGDRGELRDYFDLMTIEQRTGRTADEGLALFVARFQPEYPQQAINHILLGLGYFDDVDPDDALPVPRSDIADYWTRRQREIIAARGRLTACGTPAA